MARSTNIWSQHFLTAAAPTRAEVADDLWNNEPSVKASFSTDEHYQAAILEQYRLYVEMADRISARRALANTFFLTLNAAIFTLVGVFWKDRPEGSPWLLLLPLFVSLGLCLAWFWLVRSYRQLNSGKFAVIGALESRLPASPFWRAEWTALGKGADKSKYWPLTHLEQWVPLLFAVSYLIGVGLVIGSSAR
jgi:hypothetical protein